MRKAVQALRSWVFAFDMDTSQITSIYKYQAVDGKLSTLGQPTEAQLVSAARAGFDAVINLALYNDPHYSLPILKESTAQTECWAGFKTYS